MIRVDCSQRPDIQITKQNGINMGNQCPSKMAGYLFCFVLLSVCFSTYALAVIPHDDTGIFIRLGLTQYAHSKDLYEGEGEGETEQEGENEGEGEIEGEGEGEQEGELEGEGEVEQEGELEGEGEVEQEGELEGEGEGEQEGEVDGEAEGEDESEGEVCFLNTILSNQYTGLAAIIGLAYGILWLAEDPPSPCMVASAAYGTPIAGQITLLRLFRDTSLLNSRFGTAFVDVYYRGGGVLASYVAKHPWAARTVRLLLYPVLLLVSLSLFAPFILYGLTAFIVVLLIISSTFLWKRRTSWGRVRLS